MDNIKLFKRAVLSKTILVTMLFGSFSSFAMDLDEYSESGQASKRAADLKAAQDNEKRVKAEGEKKSELHRQEAEKADERATVANKDFESLLQRRGEEREEELEEELEAPDPAGYQSDDEEVLEEVHNDSDEVANILPSNAHVNSNGRVNKSIADVMQNLVSIQNGSMQSYLASGEESEFLNNGVWISGLVGSSKDSKHKSKNKFQGGTVGYQRFADCSSIVGVALTKLNGANKSVDANLKNSSNLLSAYTLMQLDNFLLGAYVFGGKSQVKSSRYANKNLIATGKFSSYIYGAGGSLGYAIRSENHTLTPTAGLNYYASKAKAYKEKGVDAKSIAKQSDSSLIGNIGIRYSYAIEQDEMKIVPSVAVGMMRDLMSKSKSKSAISQASAENAGVFNLDKPKKKTSLYVRPDLTLKSELFEFSLAYGFEKAKKYAGHLGSAKLLVRF
jgi:hypothetical protein